MSDISLETLIDLMDDDSSDRYDNSYGNDPFDDGIGNDPDDNQDNNLPGDPIDPSQEPDPNIDPMDPPKPTQTPAKEPDVAPSPARGEDVEVSTDPVDPEEGAAPASSSTYEEYFNILKENNLLYTSEDFEFDGTAEGLSTAIEQTKTNMQAAIAQGLWQKLPEDFKPLLQYALEGGSDINKYLDTFKAKDLASIDIEGNLENQRYVLKEYFRRTSNYDDKKIDRMVDRIYMTGEMETEAASVLEDLRQLEVEERTKLVEEQRQLKLQEEQNQKALREELASLIEEKEYIAPERKNKVKSSLFNVISKGDNADTQFNHTLRSISSNKEHLIQLADLLLDYDPKTGINLDRIQRKVGTQAVKSLKQRLEDATSNTKSKVTGTTSKIQSDNFDWNMFLQQN